jgi:hypothetical protein
MVGEHKMVAAKIKNVDGTYVSLQAVRHYEYSDFVSKCGWVARFFAREVMRSIVSVWEV